jgi:hypothetical protein
MGRARTMPTNAHLPERPLRPEGLASVRAVGSVSAFVEAARTRRRRRSCRTRGRDHGVAGTPAGDMPAPEAFEAPLRAGRVEHGQARGGLR